MKALTIQQPWAWAIARGPKRVENRKRLTSHRGPLLIHAGKGEDYLAGTLPHDWHPLIPGLPSFELLPRGALVAVCNLVECVRVEDLRGGLFPAVPPDDPFLEGPWCWILDEVEPLAAPVAWAGQQGLFDVPDDLIGSHLNGSAWRTG